MSLPLAGSTDSMSAPPAAERGPCQRCGGTDRNERNECRTCKRRSHAAWEAKRDALADRAAWRAELAADPDRPPGGPCRVLRRTTGHSRAAPRHRVGPA